MGASDDELRVLVADDHALYRRGLVMELDEAGDITVVAEATTGEQAVEAAVALAPDVILMDVRMPGIGGIEAARRVIDATPTARILMLSVSDDGDDLLEAVKAGAAGHLLKDTSVREIRDAARKVARGHSFVSSALAGRLLEEFAALAARPLGGDGSPTDALLSARELGVLRAMADGRDDAAIARVTGLPEHLVRRHVRNLLGKLQLATRTEAVLYADRARLLDP